ncbi:unnamed protein product [Didymodactylos carnosus]|uniref:ER membrane protein complex subunit 10 n=1 Tax=Didymodactylos carnosus TaxID=1234261 RepID=A0A815KSU5_9BILA|nr:unnamed protein product [Didymodactylos carnosus]CAF1397290.1 unnamed protein product [Didymodactylos carnosus]CAF4072633.1 unnamed protein product [Didymodactylos carnosus]CAF4291445.1 unnamed protein product [Didymodactylos carnosus]
MIQMTRFNSPSKTMLLSVFSKVNVRLSHKGITELMPSRVISAAQYQRLSLEAQSNHLHYYSLKITYRRHSTQDYIMTSVPLVSSHCLVVQVQFHYQISLLINENGCAVGVYLTTGNSTCSKTSISTTTGINQTNIPYKVGLRMDLTETGPQPDTQHFLEKLRREQEAKQKFQENDNRSFFLKYWKYIIPVVAIVLLQGVFADNGGQPSGGGREQR